MATGLVGPQAIAFTPSGSQAYVVTVYQLLTMSVVDGTTSVLAGQLQTGIADGQGAAALFFGPRGLIVHPVTGVIYITDTYNNRIRTCTSFGLVSTLSGTGATSNVDGSTSVATFYYPWGIVFDPTSMYLYVTCAFGHMLRQVTVLTGFTTTLATSFVNPLYAPLRRLFYFLRITEVNRNTKHFVIMIEQFSCMVYRR